jgi:uncharacterized protein HemX
MDKRRAILATAAVVLLLAVGSAAYLVGRSPVAGLRDTVASQKQTLAAKAKTAARNETKLKSTLDLLAGEQTQIKGCKTALADAGSMIDATKELLSAVLGNDPQVVFDPRVYNPAIDEMIQRLTSDINIYATDAADCGAGASAGTT